MNVEIECIGLGIHCIDLSHYAGSVLRLAESRDQEERRETWSLHAIPLPRLLIVGLEEPRDYSRPSTPKGNKGTAMRTAAFLMTVLLWGIAAQALEPSRFEDANIRASIQTLRKAAERIAVPLLPFGV